MGEESRGGYSVLQECTDIAPLVRSKTDEEAPWDDGGQQVSRQLSVSELKNLHAARGIMPPITVAERSGNAVDAAIARVEQLDRQLLEDVQAICDRIGEEMFFSSSSIRFPNTFSRYARLGVVWDVLPQILFYVVYSLAVSYYASEFAEDWDLRWSAAKQDAIYYPAVVLTFLLCFRASGCMDRYKEGLRSSFEMQKALREVAFEVMTNLVIDENEQDAANLRPPELVLRSIKRRYFKHEFRRLARLLFSCAARDLNDSALTDDDLADDEAQKIPFAMTEVEHAAVMVSHSAIGHAFRVYLVASWVLKLVKGACDEALFESPDIYRTSEHRLLAFKNAWLDARQVAYSSMPSSVTHILWLLIHIMSCMMPWEWVSVCRWSTWVPSVMLSISFFGIMEITNAMENPFGFDEEDVQIWEATKHLDEEICLSMHYSLLDEFGGENLYRSLMGSDLIFLDAEARVGTNQ